MSDQKSRQKGEGSPRYPNPTTAIAAAAGSSTLKMSGNHRQFWLLKTEPGEWSWTDQEANSGISKWDGVKNRQAQNNVRAMKAGDLCFFYHSGAKERRIVGVVSVAREWYASADGDGDGDGEGAVDVKAVGQMRRPVELREIKEVVEMKDFALVRQPRLSVVPVPQGIWARICEMGDGYEGKDAL